jgi:hypothetical protein|tara:strand:+ start:135 stop:719 length:585 start_codon:yes stop_codon:yes gene_type:complete
MPDEENVATRVSNPLALNMYCLGYDHNKKLVNLNQAVKENLQTYFGQYRMVTDAINIKNAYIINIGVQFNIMTRVGYNKHEVVLKCIRAVENYFDTDKWQIGQPIVVAELVYKLTLVDGVAAIVTPSDAKADKSGDRPQIIITNKFNPDNGYSGNLYDMENAYSRGVYYPSMDPSIFELKYPGKDIEGRAVGDL